MTRPVHARGEQRALCGVRQVLRTHTTANPDSVTCPRCLAAMRRAARLTPEKQTSVGYVSNEVFGVEPATLTTRTCPMPQTEPHPLDGQFEPAAEAVAKCSPATPLADTAAASAAISLKRIADALDGAGFAGTLEDAIVRALDNGANNAISTWMRHR